MIRQFPPTEPDPGRLGDYRAEAIVISAAIFAGPSRKRADLLAAVEPEDFADPRHRSIWKAIRILVAMDDGTATTFIRDATVAYDLRPTVDTQYLNQIIDDGSAAVRNHHQASTTNPKLNHDETRDYVHDRARHIRGLADQYRASRQPQDRNG